MYENKNKIKEMMKRFTYWFISIIHNRKLFYSRFMCECAHTTSMIATHAEDAYMFRFEV